MNKTVEYQTFEIQLDEHTFRQLETYKSRKNISTNEALIYLITRGLMAINAEAAVEIPDHEQADYQKLYMQNEAELGVLRYKMFTQLESNRNWSLSTGAIENENTAMKGVIKRLREEIEALKKELKDLNFPMQE